MDGVKFVKWSEVAVHSRVFLSFWLDGHASTGTNMHFDEVCTDCDFNLDFISVDGAEAGAVTHDVF